MVSAGRVVCITLPFFFSLGALVTLVLMFVAGTVTKSPSVDDYYFLKINLSDITISSSSSLSELSAIKTLESTTSSSSNDTALGDLIEEAKESLGVRDYYTIYLRSSCSWYASNESDYAHCTSPASFYWFNPVTAWNLNETGESVVDDILPTSLREGLSVYHSTSKAMFVLYTAALTSTAIALLVSFGAFFSRWGSLCTTLFAGVAAILYVGASAVATALFLVLRTVLNHNLRDDYDITTKVGTQSLTLTWVGAVFSVAAAFFWLFSSCCCSGRSPYDHRDAKGANGLKRSMTKAEKAPYTYERVGSPYHGPTTGSSIPTPPTHQYASSTDHLPTFGAPQPYSHDYPQSPYQNHYQHQHQDSTNPTVNPYEPLRPHQV